MTEDKSVRYRVIGPVMLATLFLVADPVAAMVERPKEKFPLVGNAKECADRAWRKIKETGRSYNSSRRGYDESAKKLNIWIGDHLFLVPNEHVNLVGSGYPSDAPGISALLVGVMPEMTPKVKPEFELIGGIDPATMIFISCNYSNASIFTAKYQSTITRESEIRLKLRRDKKVNVYPLPEFGLIGYQNEDGFSTLYFPTDSSVKNLHGGVFAIRCNKRYPVTSKDLPTPKCSIRFAYRDGVAVEFRFPEAYLTYWHVSYERLIKLLDSFLVEL